MSKKIGFWFENSGISSIDVSQPLLGNAGVGGTEYQFALLADLLLSVKGEDLKITFFVETPQKLNSSIEQVIVQNLNEAYGKASQLNIDFLIFRPRRDISNEVKAIIYKKTKLIPWLHITPKREFLDWFVNNSLIHRVIFVGDDQRMRVIDHEVYGISSTIYNSSNGFFEISTQRRRNSVVYLGALVPRKGFHILAKSWPDVRKKIPDAELYVIGSGALYDRDSQLGPMHLAEISYENEFVASLGGEIGIEKNAVHFLGNLGFSKHKFISSATVGVVNPSGLTENCPMSVVEFYQAGIPVVSSTKYGMRDMVISGETGFLCKTSKELTSVLIKFLEGSLNSENLGLNGFAFAKNKFSPNRIIEEWMRIFEGSFPQVHDIHGYWIHKSFRALKKMRLLSTRFPMVEDQKIYLASLRNESLKMRR